MRIAIINGPNLNLLGTREPQIYGSKTFDQYMEELRAVHSDIELTYFQSNVEGELVNFIQNCALDCDAIVLNAAAYTHTSLAIADAIRAIKTPVLEVHISNVYAREPERHRSFISSACKGVIVGLGLEGYSLAIQYFKLNLA